MGIAWKFRKSKQQSLNLPTCWVLKKQSLSLQFTTVSSLKAPHMILFQGDADSSRSETWVDLEPLPMGFNKRCFPPKNLDLFSGSAWSLAFVVSPMSSWLLRSGPACRDWKTLPSSLRPKNVRISHSDAMYAIPTRFNNSHLPRDIS